MLLGLVLEDRLGRKAASLLGIEEGLERRNILDRQLKILPSVHLREERLHLSPAVRQGSTRDVSDTALPFVSPYLLELTMSWRLGPLSGDLPIWSNSVSLRTFCPEACF